MAQTIILSVEDTREREFGSFGRVTPGTGEERPCDCCGKKIRIHVNVCDANVVRETGFDWHYQPIANTHRVIGRDCAKRLSASFAKANKFGELVLNARGRW